MFINFFKRFWLRSSMRSIQYLFFRFCLTFARSHAGMNPKLSCLIFIFFISPTSANCRSKLSTLKENHDSVTKKTNKVHFEGTCEHGRAWIRNWGINNNFDPDGTIKLFQMGKWIDWLIDRFINGLRLARICMYASLVPVILYDIITYDIDVSKSKGSWIDGLTFLSRSCFQKIFP